MNQNKIEKIYPMLTNDLKRTNICEYELGLILASFEEYKRSYKQVFVHEATSDGTVIEFVAMLDSEDRNDFKNYLIKIVKEFEAKYDGWNILHTLNLN